MQPMPYLSTPIKATRSSTSALVSDDFRPEYPSWLKEHNFPDGSIHVPQTDEDRNHLYDFKTRILKDFIDHGWNIKFAYGDSSMDFAAYAAVGIPKDNVFALLRNGKTLCESGDWKECLKGWTNHLDFVKKSVQPVPTD